MFHISINLFLEITIIANGNGTVLSRPVISFKGVPISHEDVKDFKIDLEDEIYKICKTFSINNPKQEHNVKDKLKSNCRKFFKEKTGKKPFTNINLIRI